MKIKNVIITLGTLAVLAGGGITAALHFGVGSGSAAKVEVVPVSVLNNNYWYGDDSSNTIEGTIVSRDSQNVDLNTEYELTDVYVKEGEMVRKGDPLLAYDMTMLQLQLEVRELRGQMLDLDLAKQEKELEKVLQKPGAAAIYAKLEESTEVQKTRSAQIEGEAFEEKPAPLALSGMGDGEESILEEEEGGSLDDDVDPELANRGTTDGNTSGSGETGVSGQGFVPSGTGSGLIDDDNEITSNSAGTGQAAGTGVGDILGDAGRNGGSAGSAGAGIVGTALSDEKDATLAAGLLSAAEGAASDLEEPGAGDDLLNPGADPGAGGLSDAGAGNGAGGDPALPAAGADGTLSGGDGTDPAGALPGDIVGEELLPESGQLPEEGGNGSADGENGGEGAAGELPGTEIPGDGSDIDPEPPAGEEASDPNGTTLTPDEDMDVREDEPGNDVIDPDGTAENPGALADMVEEDSEMPADGLDFDAENELVRLRLRITEFLTLEESVRTFQYMDYLESGEVSEFGEDEIATALKIYEEELAAVPDSDRGTVVTLTDAFENQREEKLYALSSMTKIALKDLEEQYQEEGDISFSAATAEVNLYKAYLNLMAYDLIIKMNPVISALNAQGADPESASDELVESLRPQITAAADAWYKFDLNRKLILWILANDYGYSEEAVAALQQEYEAFAKPYGGENLQLEDPSDGILSRLIVRLNGYDIMEDPEALTETDIPATEAVTEQSYPGYSDDDFDDFGYDGYDDGDDEDDAESLEESVRNARNNVNKAKLDIRENKIKVRELQRKLQNQTVKAELDGIVKSAGTLTESSGDEYFIMISGESGLYLEGSLGELDLETLQVGDVVAGSSYDNGATFTATITEISEYPNTNNSGYGYMSGWGMESKNTNVSNYPFTAYIEDAEGLIEGSAQVKLPSSQSGSGILLEAAYVRTDDQGRDYVMAAGEDGLLEKRYVSTGISYGLVRIKDGLKEEDQIAFPYGKNVVEGAQTVTAENYDSFYF